MQQLDLWLNEILIYFQRSQSTNPLVEVLINGCKSMELIYSNERIVTSSPFNNSAQFQEKLQDLAFASGLRLDPNLPAAGGAIGNSLYRWHALIAPAVVSGPLFSLRRHRFLQLGLGDFCFVDKQDRTVLKDIFLSRKPILICGPTGSGKTTLMAALLSVVAERERVVILENVSELPELHPTWVKLVSRPKTPAGASCISLDFLFAEALRLRPDRLVVGEIRSDELSVFVDSILSGHQGVISTIHADSVLSLRSRLNKLAEKSYWNDGLLGLLEGMACVFMGRAKVPEVLSIEFFK